MKGFKSMQLDEIGSYKLEIKGLNADVARLESIIDESRARVAKLEAVLTEIAKTRFGLDITDTEEEQTKYWSDMALAYRRKAIDALK